MGTTFLHSKIYYSSIIYICVSWSWRGLVCSRLPFTWVHKEYIEMKKIHVGLILKKNADSCYPYTKINQLIYRERNMNNTLTLICLVYEHEWMTAIVAAWFLQPPHHHHLNKGSLTPHWQRLWTVSKMMAAGYHNTLEGSQLPGVSCSPSVRGDSTRLTQNKLSDRTDNTG